MDWKLVQEPPDAIRFSVTQTGIAFLFTFFKPQKMALKNNITQIQAHFFVSLLPELVQSCESQAIMYSKCLFRNVTEEELIAIKL